METIKINESLIKYDYPNGVWLKLDRYQFVEYSRKIFFNGLRFLHVAVDGVGEFEGEIKIASNREILVLPKKKGLPTAELAKMFH